MGKNKIQKNKEYVPKKTRVLRIFLILLIIIWAYIVFTFSSQDGTDSSGLSRKFVEIFIKDDTLVDIIEPYARKVAHFSEYGLGGVLFILLFSTYKWNDRRKIAISIILGVWYATLDEIHQLLVPGRHAGIADVWIDSLGFSTGVMVMMLIFKILIICKTKNEKNTNFVKN